MNKHIQPLGAGSLNCMLAMPPSCTKIIEKYQIKHGYEIGMSSSQNFFYFYSSYLLRSEKILPLHRSFALS